MDDLEQIINFLRISSKMKEIYRFTPKSNNSFENDAEHSWNVGVICMVLASRLEKEFNIKLDLEKILKMALIHDLAEVRTGDTKTWDNNPIIDKDKKERLAIKEILSTLPEDLQEEFMQIWEECEQRTTLEAKIVKSIDRIEPVVHRTLLNYGWENLRDEGDHSMPEALDERQLPRHDFSKVITEIYTRLRKEAVERGMFHFKSKYNLLQKCVL